MNRHQALALEQLKEISAAKQSPLRVAEVLPCKEGQRLHIEITLETSELPKQPGGLIFRRREPLTVSIPTSFPFKPPSLAFRHTDYSGAAHVNWGRSVCLFQSAETEWVPSDGMYGFFSRVDSWFKAASLGQLDPEDAPLHPPANVPTANIWFIPCEDTPEIRVGSGNWIGWAGLKKQSETKFDVVAWAEESDVSEDQIAIPAILLDQPLAFEYPEKVSELFALLEARGVDRSTLNRIFLSCATASEQGKPLDIIVGSPMRRKSAGSPIKQHLAVWRVPADAMDHLRAALADIDESSDRVSQFVQWSFDAQTAWCRVLENRPEIVVRRDEGTHANWLADKTILLIGAGALGGPIAEDIVRAAAKRLHVVDGATVHPGILVRQRFAKTDVARPKAKSLATRLNGLDLGCDVVPYFQDMTDQLGSLVDLRSIDLVIDATGSTYVANCFETLAGQGALPPPLVSLSISARAEHGMASVRMPEFKGGPIEIARRAKLEAFSQDPVNPSAAAFWPEPSEKLVFQPEPGCSDPTFVGSASTVGFHAAGLLELATQRVSTLRPDVASCDFIPGAAFQIVDGQYPAVSNIFESRTQHTEQINSYVVRVDSAAEATIHSEMARSKRVVGTRVETGGLLFGEIDDGHRMIWLDQATGPPSDSNASEEKFICGTNGTSELAELLEARTRGSSRFVGIWHTHPASLPEPSRDDLGAMVELLLGQHRTPRHVVMMIIGFAATSPTPRFYLYRRKDMEAFIPTYPERKDFG